jgi:hypothetical protein
MRIKFTCGTVQAVDPDKTPSPVCGHCGTRQISRVLDARAPRFSGTVTGPHADTKRLDPMAVNLAERPLTLKPDPLSTPEKVH